MPARWTDILCTASAAGFGLRLRRRGDRIHSSPQAVSPLSVRGGSRTWLSPPSRSPSRRSRSRNSSPAPDVGFAKALFFGKFKGELLFPYPTLPPDKQAAADEMAAKVRGVRRRAHRPHADRPRGPHPRFGRSRGSADLGVYRMTIPHRVRRAGLRPAAVPEDDGDPRRARRQRRGVRERPPLASASGRCVLFGTKEQQAKWLPGPARRLEALRLRAHRTGGRVRRRQRADDRDADRRRHRVHPQRHQALHHQRRHRAHPHRDGPHADAATAKSEGHGVPGHARHAGLRGGRGPRREVRHPRHRDRQDAVHQHARAEGEHPRRSSAAGCRRRSRCSTTAASRSARPAPATRRRASRR